MPIYLHFMCCVANHGHVSASSVLSINNSVYYLICGDYDGEDGGAKVSVFSWFHDFIAVAIVQGWGTHPTIIQFIL